MKRRMYGLMILLALVMSLAACGGTGTVSNEPAETAAETETAAAAQEETEAPAETETSLGTSDAETLAAEGAESSFETTDLAGNAVSSADIFSAHKLTMINIWGTYCGPCVNEMPDLEELNGRLAEKDCAIIGVVCDVRGSGDTKTIGIAKDIVSQTGVTYLNLLPWETFWDTFPAEFIPTTYFIDAQGNILGEPAVGARGADDYEALVDEILAGME